MKKKTKSSLGSGINPYFYRAGAAIVFSLLLALAAFSGEIGTPPPVEDERAEKAEKAIAKAMAVAQRFCVGVRMKFTPPPSDDTELRKLHRVYGRMLEEYRSMEIPNMEGGVIIGPNLVLVDIPFLRPEDVESITITTADGKTYPAVPGGLLQNFNGFVLKVNTSGGVLYAPEWGGKPPEKPGDGYVSATMYHSDGCWMLSVAPKTVTGSNVTGKTRILSSDGLSYPSLLIDKEGKPFGVSTRDSLWRDAGGRTSFDGAEIQEDKLHDIEDVLAFWENLENTVAPCTLPLVTFVFRPLEEGESSTWYARRSATLEEERVYGVFIDDAGTVFIPGTLPVEKVKRIDRITVECGETSRQATFVGSFRDFDGILVKVQDYTAESPPSIRRHGKARRGELLYSAVVSYSFGGRFMQFIPNRITTYGFGVGGSIVPYTMVSMSSRNILLDSEGRAIGFMSYEYPEEADGTKSAASASRRQGYSRLFFFNDVAEMLESPAQYFDPKAKVLTREEEKKLAWLGVEYQTMNHKLAKYLKILGETKNGQMGFMVIHIYPGSPADRLHLRNGDVLLSLRPLDEKTSIELIGSGSGYSRYYGRRRYFGGFGKPTPPWRARKNTLTDTLTWIGKDRRTELTFLRRSGKEGFDARTVTLTVEESPPDFSSAEEYKDKALGFTAKELTYEARFYQKLPEEERGIVISEVESGLAAEIAKLRPFEIVREVDGVPVRGLDHFKGLITQAMKDESKKTIRFLVVTFGQTRFADLEKK